MAVRLQLVPSPGGGRRGCVCVCVGGVMSLRVRVRKRERVCVGGVGGGGGCHYILNDANDRHPKAHITQSTHINNC